MSLFLLQNEEQDVNSDYEFDEQNTNEELGNIPLFKGTLMQI